MAPAVPPPPASGQHSQGDQPQDGRARLGDGRDRPEQAVRIVFQPGGEIERVRRTCVATATEAQGPKFGFGKRLTRVEHQRAYKCSGRQVIGIDLRQAVDSVVVADEQVAAKLAPTRGRDGEPPGSGQMNSCRVVNQRLEESAVRAEFIHDAARGRLVRERDEEGRCPVDVEVLTLNAA